MVAVNNIQIGQCTALTSIANERYTSQIGYQCQCPITFLIIFLSAQYALYHASLSSANASDMATCSNDIATLCMSIVVPVVEGLYRTGTSIIAVSIVAGRIVISSDSALVVATLDGTRIQTQAETVGRAVFITDNTTVFVAIASDAGDILTGSDVDTA